MKKNFDAKMILNKKFKNELSGYNVTEVDMFFDKVIEDYNAFEEKISTLEDVTQEQKKTIMDKEEEIKKMELEMSNLLNQLKTTEKATNAELMKAIKDIQHKIG